MIKSHKKLFGISGIVALGLIAALGVAALNTHLSSAQAPTPTPGTNQSAPGATLKKGALSQYTDFFLQALANRLGTTVDKLKAAYLGALGDTLSQAVKDGNLTQTQANQAQTNAQNWVNSGMQGLPFLGFRGEHRFGRGYEFENLIGDFAKAMNMDTQTLTTDLRNGQSLAQIAQANKLDIKQVEQTVLADVKSQLDQAVQNKQLTQTQADQIYQNLSTNIDTYANQTGFHGFPGHGFGPHGKGYNGEFGPEAPNQNPPSSTTTPSGTVY